MNPLRLIFPSSFGRDLTEISFNEWDRVTERDNLHSNYKFVLTHLKIAEMGGGWAAQSQVHQINKSISVRVE